MREPIAIAFADLHLSLQQPACRADKSWLDVQAGYLKQVKNLAKELGDVPVLFAGDLFDRWNPTPELINFALEHLPDNMICVPGQHDLPNHRIDDMNRCGYGVLVRTGKIQNVAGNSAYKNRKNSFDVFGFGWGQEMKESADTAFLGINTIAVVHRYLWTDGKSYPDAPKDTNIYNLKKQFQGYDVVISGDNHTFFTAKVGNTTVFNPGTFIRRKSDERMHKPCVAIIYEGSVKRHLLDTSQDLFHEDVDDRKEMPLDMKAFIEGLESLGEQGIDFREAVKQHLDKEVLSEQTREIILKAIQ